MSISKRGTELPGGIYCPIATFFLDTPGQELDMETNIKHFEFLAKAGVAGVAVQGSTGESVALTREEKKIMIRTAKEVFERIGNPGIIIAGTVGAQSTWENVQLANDAAEAGADFILTLPPSYYAPAMTPDAIQAFYEDLADQSPLPVIIYSYPSVVSGINMDSDLVMRLARHPNIAGVKHTDHDVGRIARECRDKNYGSPFTVLGGATDYLLGTVAYGGDGAITGISNVAPRATIKVYELAKAGKFAEARKLAGEVSKGEWVMGRNKFTGAKYSIQFANNYPASAAKTRKPVPEVEPSGRIHVESEVTPLAAIERQLEKEGFVGEILSTKSNGTTNGIKLNGLTQKIKETVNSL
ncbi:hypothetical protein M231_05842 [Tremella mesenterica]|uniref:Dihydrodipicolinate synthase n=1 Tax=Tremella mesenterica TaxID=5217 RepID=A0A4Q1BH04_TREME|nr:uncharacterized protein TREMEDRAFT_70222 [Tremella mesenterica DSM 1558]EIW66318.1 hypothetical protein TREMEDRAFT_70222 [Tremella mesenterica DSM 1558]RXK36868.1 hypothetical protein M231_05842 [Tremella mesenterica]